MTNAYDALLAQYYTPDDRRQAFFQSLGSLGAGLIAAGAPSTNPGAFGQGISQGLLGMQGAMQQGQQQALQRGLLGTQLADRQDKLEQRRRWAAMFGGGAPSPLPGSPAGAGGAPPQPSGAASPATDPLASFELTPAERQTLAMLGPEEGAKFLAQRQAKRAELGSWEPATDPYGRIGQRNKYTGEFRIDEILKAQASRPQVSVTTKVEEKGRGELAVLGAKGFQVAQEAASDASKREAMFSAYEQLLDGFQSGATADIRLRAKQVAKDIFGLDVGEGDIAAGETLKSAGRVLELAATPRGQGQITENERVLIREQMPQLTNTPEGNRLVIRMLRQLDAYDRKVAEVYRAVAREGNGFVDPVKVSERIAELGPAMDPQFYAALARGRQAAPAGTAPAPAAGASPPAAPKQPDLMFDRRGRPVR